MTGVSGTEPRSAARVRGAGLLLVLLSLVPALGGYLVLSVWVPSDMERRQDYLAAEPCLGPAETETETEAGARAEAAEDCVLTVAFVVERTKNDKRGKGSSYTATLSSSVWNGTVSFGDPDPVLERLVPGDRVTGTVWRGQVMTVGKGELRQNTSDAPRDEPQFGVGVGTFLELVAALGLWFGAVRIVRPRDVAPLTWRPLGRTLLIVTGIAGLVVALVSVWIGVPYWVVPGVLVAIVGVTAWQLYKHHRQEGAVPGADG
ncbi:hypothetical protein [Streptomyces sp. S.PB5]|uniref:hypothetical protein n=1 Tax=Streptomyces sp. S.PB5 TaxID=3020844 RepID=UPI0025B27375|nr:hypothetical protein [Streptomyces sp. S.PB5]MDN3022602.1 hypothetical protein [Streptomyces sp. S.PB5]